MHIFSGTGKSTKLVNSTHIIERATITDELENRIQFHSPGAVGIAA
jgi:hypothetical protein